MPEREYRFVFCSNGCDIGDILQIVAVAAILVAGIALVWAFNVHLNRDIARGRRAVLKRVMQGRREHQQHVAVEDQRFIDHQNWLAEKTKGRGLTGSAGGDGHPRQVTGSVRTGRGTRASRLSEKRLSGGALEQQRRLRIEQGRTYALSAKLGLGERKESVSERAYRKYLERTTEDRSKEDGEESVKAMMHVDWPNA